MAESITDVLIRVADANRNIGVLLVELLNANHPGQAGELREIGQHLGALSAECLGRAAELDGRRDQPPERVAGRGVPRRP